MWILVLGLGRYLVLGSVLRTRSLTNQTGSSTHSRDRHHSPNAYKPYLAYEKGSRCWCSRPIPCTSKSQSRCYDVPAADFSSFVGQFERCCCCRPCRCRLHRRKPGHRSARLGQDPWNLLCRMWKIIPSHQPTPTRATYHRGGPATHVGQMERRNYSFGNWI
jgi:hypothetical protein